MSDRAPAPNPRRGPTWAMDEDVEPIIQRDPQFENLIAQLIPRQKGQPTALLEVVGHGEGMITVRPPDAAGMEPFGAHSASGLHVEPGDLVLAVQVADTWYLLDSVTDSLAYGFGEGPFGESAFGGATGGSGEALTQGKADTLYASKSRVDPGIAGTEGQELAIVSGVPAWRNTPTLVFDERDYASRQAAMDAAAVAVGNHAYGGGIVYTPRGSHVMTETLYHPYGVEWRGVGMYGTRMIADPAFVADAGGAMVRMGRLATVNNAYWDHAMIMRGIELDCNNVAGLGGVYSDTAQEPSGLYEVTISRHRGYGVRVAAPSTEHAAMQFLISDCQIYHSVTDVANILPSISFANLGLSGVVRRTTLNVYENAAATVIPVAIRAENTKVYLETVHIEHATTGVGVTLGANSRGGLYATMLSGHPTVGTLVDVTDNAPHHLVALIDDGAAVTVSPNVGTNLIGYVGEFDNSDRNYVPRQSPTITTSAYRYLDVYDSNVLVDATAAAVWIDLPGVQYAKGVEFVIKKIDGTANTVTISRTGTDTIEGAATLVLPAQYNYARILGTASGWLVVGGTV